MLQSELIKKIKNYQPINEAEEKHKQKVLEFLECGENCFVRDNLRAHMTGGGLLVSGDGSKVLMNHHLIHDRWLQFGGHADGEVDILQVALRETREESGISQIEVVSEEILDIDSHFIPSNEERNESEHRHFELRFVFKTDEERFVVSSESKELRWFEWAEIKGLTREEGLLRLLEKGEKLMLSGTV